jgi:serine/threonine protein phosphatase PrpC
MMNRLRSRGSFATIQGKRDHQEDRVFSTSFSFPHEGGGLVEIYGVLDGHGGHHASELLRTLLPTKFKELILRKPDLFMRRGVQGDVSAIKKMFLEVDLELYRREVKSGSTASIVIITPLFIYMVNLGDSRIQIDSSEKLRYETLDHKPSQEIERRRIIAAGGTVSSGRVDGILAVSRAFGDFDFKNLYSLHTHLHSKVGIEPLIVKIPRKIETVSYRILIASDGVWDQFSAAIDLIPFQGPLGRRVPIEKAPGLILSKSDLHDNTTAYVIDVPSITPPQAWS